MTPQTETALRSLGVLVAFAIVSTVLTFLSTSTNLTFLGGSVAPIVASLAAILLNTVDKMYSPNGTVAFGTIGKQY